MTSSAKPLLVYWDIRALAEPIRLLLHFARVDFEDRRIPFGEMGPSLLEPWMSQKYSQGLDFPNLPYYVEGNLKISQSSAILQHLARKHNLYGDNLEEQAKIDMVAGTVNDLRWSAWVTYNDGDFHQIKEDWKRTLPGRLGELSTFLEGKEFVLGKKISYVDFLLYESMEWYRKFAPEVFAEAKELVNLEQFQKRIEALPQIKAYMESDQFKEWPLFAPIVNFGYSRVFKLLLSIMNFITL